MNPESKVSRLWLSYWHSKPGDFECFNMYNHINFRRRCYENIFEHRRSITDPGWRYVFPAGNQRPAGQCDDRRSPVGDQRGDYDRDRSRSDDLGLAEKINSDERRVSGWRPGSDPARSEGLGERRLVRWDRRPD